jgi:GNAT superfamily N-acetyltransferase
VNGAPLRSPGDAPAAPPRAHLRDHLPAHFRAHFRRARPDDVEAVARVHFEAAQQAYRNVLPAGAIVGAMVDMTYQRRLALWGGLLGSPGELPRVELAVEAWSAQGDEAVAFAWWRKAQDPEAAYGGEIHALYVLPARQRRGLGRRLMAHTARRMAGTGLKSCRLWAFVEHRAARRFYLALGGRPIGRRWETLGGRRVPLVAYAWDPIDRLMAQDDPLARTATP